MGNYRNCSNPAMLVVPLDPIRNRSNYFNNSKGREIKLIPERPTRSNSKSC